MFKSFFPHPKIFFPSLILWSIISISAWYGFNQEIGGLIGLGREADLIEFVAGNFRGQSFRIDAQQKQDFSAIDISNSGDHLLIHQQAADGRPPILEIPPDEFRIGIVAKRIWSQSGFDLLKILVLDQLATIGPIQIKRLFLSNHPKSNSPPRLGRRIVVQAKLPIQSKMNVDDLFA